MGLLSWIVVGLIAGWLAGLVVKGRGMGCLGNIIVGVIGALIGGWLAGSVFHLGVGISGINIPTLIVAFAGSVLLLFVFKLFRARS
ncbi:MAG: GlsB/YeaQ/YmgE family stress response membrane protein [Anaerolineaceae bacterium]